MTPDSLKQARAKEAVSGEELDKWRAQEARREWAQYIADEQPTKWDRESEVAERAARLAREGVMPPEPINPDLIEARECCALVAEAMGAHGLAVEYRGGGYDDQISIQSILLVIERAKGREAGS